MHDGVLYVSTAWSMVKAYRRQDRRAKWAYDPKVPRETLPVACCDAVNRGVALYGDKVYVATLDGYLVALEPEGRLGRLAQGIRARPQQLHHHRRAARRQGQGVHRRGGAEYRARGFIAAFDWATGNELWRFHTVPGDPAKGVRERRRWRTAAKTWGGEWWKLGGGGTVWDAITYDPATNLVYFGTGNAEPWNPAANGRDKPGGKPRATTSTPARSSR